jgi:glycosylphosphatidylinositol transamidase (GPIT) subunit GPI8
MIWNDWLNSRADKKLVIANEKLEISVEMLELRIEALLRLITQLSQQNQASIVAEADRLAQFFIKHYQGHGDAQG